LASAWPGSLTHSTATGNLTSANTLARSNHKFTDCADLDAEASAFRDRSLAGDLPYVFVDVTYSQPALRAIRMASMRLRPPTLAMALDR
jgi:hypothetical protein